LILRLKWVKQILRIGLPSAIGQAGTAVGFVLLMGLVSRLGVVAVSAYGIGQRIIGLLNIAIWGLASPLTTMIGQNIGAENKDRASLTAKRAYSLSFTVLSGLAIVVFLLKRPLFRIFIDDMAVIDVGARFITMFIWSIPFFGVFVLTSSVFRGSGHTRPPMVMSLIRLLLLRVGVSYLLAFGIIGINMGADGIWLGLFASNFLSGIIAFGWFLTGSWKSRTIENAGQEEVASEEVKESTETASLSGSSVD
jgi:Na+-driven multidrug efflux pump